MAKRKTVALVMPVRNEEQAVPLTLEAVFRSSRMPDEIIVADGESSDRTVERIKAVAPPNVRLRVVENRTIYCGGGRNVGISATDCEVILIADFGNAVDPKWVEEMVRPFEEEPGIDMVGGMARPLVTSDFEHCMAAIHYHDMYTLDRLLERYGPDERDALLPSAILPGGNCIGISRDLWERLGGYPEWLPRAQDKLFSRKAHCLGARVRVAWNASIAHHVRSSPRQVFRQLFGYGRGSGHSRYLNRHFVKLAGFYTLLLGLGGLSVFVPWVAALPLGLLTAYYYRAGLRKVISVDRGLKKVKYVWLTAAVLFPRDLGTLTGQLVGWCEWFFVPRYRKLFWQYMSDCDRPAIRLMSE